MANDFVEEIWTLYKTVRNLKVFPKALKTSALDCCTTRNFYFLDNPDSAKGWPRKKTSKTQLSFSVHLFGIQILDSYVHIHARQMSRRVAKIYASIYLSQLWCQQHCFEVFSSLGPSHRITSSAEAYTSFIRDICWPLALRLPLDAVDPQYSASIRVSQLS